MRSLNSVDVVAPFASSEIVHQAPDGLDLGQGDPLQELGRHVRAVRQRELRGRRPPRRRRRSARCSDRFRASRRARSIRLRSARQPLRGSRPQGPHPRFRALRGGRPSKNEAVDRSRGSTTRWPRVDHRRDSVFAVSHSRLRPCSRFMTASIFISGVRFPRTRTAVMAWLTRLEYVCGSLRWICASSQSKSSRWICPSRSSRSMRLVEGRRPPGGLGFDRGPAG